MATEPKTPREFVPLNIAVLTISDRRNESTDTSGQTLVDRLQEAGHRLAERAIASENIYKIRAIVSRWIAESDINVVITNGGTGLTGSDVTVDAIKPLLDKEIEGFGEIFRTISYQEIKTSAIQSRAFAGIAYNKYIFCLPGSTRACCTAWDSLISLQLDNRNGRCNLVEIMPRLLQS